MDPENVTIEWLKQQKFELQNVYKPPTIEGVVLKDLNPLVDGRGDVIELWSDSWAERDGFLVPKHVYQSATDYGVIKGWHLHKEHTDQFTVTRGKLQVLLVDIRPNSPTFGHVNSIFLGVQRPRILIIPPGIMHGWNALTTPEVIVVNFQTHVYDSSDEYKLPFDCVLEELWEPNNG